LEVAGGRVVAECRDSHTARDFLSFLKKLDQEFPTGMLHVILDNSSAHKTAEVLAWLRAHPASSFTSRPRAPLG
jgi:hypothetical protein